MLTFFIGVAVGVIGFGIFYLLNDSTEVFKHSAMIAKLERDSYEQTAVSWHRLYRKEADRVAQWESCRKDYEEKTEFWNWTKTARKGSITAFRRSRRTLKRISK